MIDLSKFQQAVWAAKTIEHKRNAMLELIANSHARKETKEKAVNDTIREKSPTRLDFFAANFGLSGEGLKTR